MPPRDEVLIPGGAFVGEFSAADPDCSNPGVYDISASDVPPRDKDLKAGGFLLGVVARARRGGVPARDGVSSDADPDCSNPEVYGGSPSDGGAG